MDLGLAGKAVIVTGGGSNIGRAIALTFAKEGANVTIADLDIAQGEKVAAQANALKAGGRSIAVKTNVTSTEDTENMVKKTIDEFGRVDVLVNGVGFEELYLFTETTPEFWDKIININYKGVLNCTKAVLPHLIDQQSGSIVSVGSDAGRIGEFKEAVYGGCKAAIMSFSKTIARENGRFGIRANVVCPGMTVPTAEEIGEGSMWKENIGLLGQEYFDKAAKAYPLRRLGTAQELANAAVFLGSDAASFITGQIVSVSGGYSMM